MSLIDPINKEEFLHIFGSFLDASKRLDCTRQRLYLRFNNDVLDREFSDYLVGYCITNGIAFKLPLRYLDRYKTTCQSVQPIYAVTNDAP